MDIIFDQLRGNSDENYNWGGGTPGPQGPMGPQGPRGEQGPQGPAGPQGPIGSDGPQGPKGGTGPAGPQGEQGLKGDTGDKGEPGLTGPRGPIGETGPAGPRGEKGLKGDTGDKGEPGLTGPRGLIGETGPAGPQGEKGLTGPQGPKGDTGPQGPKGDTGPQGPKGDMDLSQITVGGRNLTLGTRDFSGGNFTELGTLTPNDFQGLTSSSGSSQYSGPRYTQVVDSKSILSNQSSTFIASIWLNNTGTSPVDINLYGTNISKQNYKIVTLQANSGWIRVKSIPFNCTADLGQSVVIRFSNPLGVQSGVIKQAGFKLEAGNVATDWTPAPEDLMNKSRELPAEARDFNYLATHMQTYQGTWYSRNDVVANAPTDNWTWSIVEVIAGNAETTGVIRTMRFATNAVYSASVSGGFFPRWSLIADDRNVVHKTETETIPGDKTFTSPINGNLSGNATTATKWQTARTLALTGDVTGSVSIDGSNNVSIATTVVKGTKGDTGPQGPQGEPGPTGPQGPIGETGPQGPKGEPGPTGPQGPIGKTGPQGPQGAQGPKGDTPSLEWRLVATAHIESPFNDPTPKGQLRYWQLGNMVLADLTTNSIVITKAVPKDRLDNDFEIITDSGTIPREDDGNNWYAVPMDTNQINSVVQGQRSGESASGNPKIRVRVSITDIAVGKYVRLGTAMYHTTN